jgi:hypothetical protein
MKLIFTKANNNTDDAVIINDINIVDILADDAEATDILVDEFLNQFSYADAGKVLNKILSKLRLGGSITVVQTDGELICYHLARGMIDLERFNEIVFPYPCKSLMSLEIVEALLKNAGIKIVSKHITENDIAIVKGTRNA